MDPIDALAIILSIVSLIITTIGFFASLKFYRDGVELQRLSNDALTKIEEKTQFIQGQVGGIFERTLDAALGRRELLSESFAELNEQLESAKNKIIEETLTQIGMAGEQERKRLTELVDNQIEDVRKKVEMTQESVETLTSEKQEARGSSVLHQYLSRVSTSLNVRLEKEVLDLMKRFDGQKVPGYLFNTEDTVTLPSFHKLSSNFIATPFEGIRREVDILGESADVKWIVEITARTLNEVRILDELVYLAGALNSKPWLVAFSDIPDSMRKAARKRGVLLTGLKEIDELTRLVDQQRRA